MSSGNGQKMIEPGFLELEIGFLVEAAILTQKQCLQDCSFSTQAKFFLTRIIGFDLLLESSP